MSPNARLGAFMIGALIIVGVFIIKIEEIPLGSRSGRTKVQASFPSVAGLDEKSPVRLAGVRVGLVERIDLEGDRALVTLALDANVPLRQGASAEVTSLGMLGDKYIELYPGPAGNPPLAAGTVLQGTSPVGFDQVLKTANEMGTDLSAVTESLRQSLGGHAGQARLDEIIENIRQISAELKTLVRANREQVDATVENFRAFSETLRVELPKLAEKLNALADNVDGVVAENRGNLNESLTNIKDLSTSLRVSADNLNTITAKIASGEGTIGKLVNDDETVNNLNSTLKSVESGVESLRNTIGRAERWRLDLELRAEALPELPENRTSRSTLGFDLHTSDSRFFRLELVDSPFGRVETRSQIVTTVYPDGTEETTVKNYTDVRDDTTVNAQIGYHLGDIALRAGLFESTGGVGVDQFLLKKRLRLSLEAYDFNRENHAPHLRLEGRYYATKHLFAYGGWDDPTFSERRSVFVGGGVTWGDEDVKYLFGAASSVGGTL
jgi:phospholipid/cholesterol/gamma-HCH transport system substrate-binding protein